MYIDMNNCMNFCWGKNSHCLFDFDVLIDETKNFIEDDEDRCIEEIEDFIRDYVYEATSNDEIDVPEDFWTIITTIVLYECYKKRILLLDYNKNKTL